MSFNFNTGLEYEHVWSVAIYFVFSFLFNFALPVGVCQEHDNTVILKTVPKAHWQLVQRSKAVWLSMI